MGNKSINAKIDFKSKIKWRWKIAPDNIIRAITYRNENIKWCKRIGETNKCKSMKSLRKSSTGDFIGLISALDSRLN